MIFNDITIWDFVYVAAIAFCIGLIFGYWLMTLTMGKSCSDE